MSYLVYYDANLQATARGLLSLYGLERIFEPSVDTNVVVPVKWAVKNTRTTVEADGKYVDSSHWDLNDLDLCIIVIAYIHQYSERGRFRSFKKHTKYLQCLCGYATTTTKPEVYPMDKLAVLANM